MSETGEKKPRGRPRGTKCPVSDDVLIRLYRSTKSLKGVVDFLGRMEGVQVSKGNVHYWLKRAGEPINKTGRPRK